MGSRVRTCTGRKRGRVILCEHRTWSCTLRMSVAMRLIHMPWHGASNAHAQLLLGGKKCAHPTVLHTKIGSAVFQHSLLLACCLLLVHNPFPSTERASPPPNTRGAAGQLSPRGPGRGSLTATQAARGERRGKSGSGADDASETVNQSLRRFNFAFDWKK